MADPTKKALEDMRKMARQMRVARSMAADDSSDDLNELTATPSGMDHSEPQHFLEELRSPMDFRDSATANDLFDFRRKKK